MGMILMVKRRCACGEVENVIIDNGKRASVRWYQVVCKTCGRKSLKHADPESAVRDWNEMDGKGRR